MPVVFVFFYDKTMVVVVEDIFMDYQSLSLCWFTRPCHGMFVGYRFHSLPFVCGRR